MNKDVIADMRKEGDEGRRGDLFRQFLRASIPLVGREKELEQLQQYWRKAKKGWGRFVLVTGEAGIGKTLLVETFLNAIEPESVELLRCSFRNGGAIRPYKAFLSVLSEYTARKREMGEEVPSIVEVLLEAEDLQSGEIRNKSGDYSRMAFVSAMMQHNIAHALIEVCRRKPLILALYDVHLASLTTWQFLHYFSKNIKSYPILMIGTLRQDQRVLNRLKRPPYVDVLKRMSKEDLSVRVRLSRFEESQTRRLLRCFFPKSDFDNYFIPQLHHYSGGNPFFLVSEIRHLIAEEIIYQKQGIWFNKQYEFRSGGASGNNIGKGFEELIREYLCNLEPSKKKILAYASLLGPSFEYEGIAEVTGLLRLQLLKILESFQAHPHILRYVSGKYRFNHPLIQELIQKELDEETKSKMHLQIACAIEKMDCDDKIEKAYLLAHHYAFTAEDAKTFGYSLKAGDLAVRNFAFFEARKFYLQAHDRIAAVSQRERLLYELHLLLQLAWLHRVLGDWELSLHCCQEALNKYYSTVGVRTVNEILLQKGLTLFRLNRWQQALECFEQCLRTKGNISCFDEAMAKYGTGNIYFELGDWNRARQSFLESMELAKEIGADYLIANLLNNLGAVENVSGRRIKALCYYSQGIPICQRIGNNLGLARIYNNIGLTHAEEENWQKANIFYGKSLALSDKMGFLPLKLTTFLNRAVALLKLKRYKEAREYNSKARRILNNVKDNLSLAEYYKIQGMIEREDQNWEKARRAFSKARAIFRKYKNRLGVAENQYEEGILYQQQGNLQAAEKYFRRALHEYENLGLKEKVQKIKQQMHKT